MTNRLHSLTRSIGVLFVSAVLLVMSVHPANVGAATSAEIRAQVNELQSQINAGKAQIAALAAQADSLQKAIATLNTQIDKANAEITQTGLRIAELEAKLVATQNELDRQTELLKDSMRALYKKGGASTVELLIGSDSFSQFIDSQEYFTRLKTAIQASTEKVIALKHDLQGQKDQQQVLLDQQQQQKASVEATKSDRQRLLDQTQGDEARYRSLVANLAAKQAEANKRLFAQIQLESGNGNNGGYPYNNYAFSMTPGGCGPGEGPDRWYYCTRQCVSYAAWAVERSGRTAPYGYGNAVDWASAAPGSWQHRDPRVGDVGVKVYNSDGSRSTYGHVAYVEALYGDGTMRISQYNAQLTGRYSEATVPVHLFDTYITFP